MGIGLAIARGFATRGANVVLAARREDALRDAVATLESLRTHPEQRFEFRSLDVSNPAAFNETAQSLVNEFGAPAFLVNNAGRAIPDHFENIPHAQFAETMAINLHGVWNGCAAFVPFMKAAGGTIVNVSSVAGLIGVFGYTDYSASKFAIIGFSEALRAEMKPHGIRVAVLCPPDTQTPGLDAENVSKPKETRALSATTGVLDSDAVAEALFRGLERNRFLIVPGRDAKASALAARIAPGLLRGFIDRAIAKARR